MTAKKHATALEAFGHSEKGAQPRQEDAHGHDVDTGCFVVADGVGQGQGGQHGARVAVEQVLDVARDRRHLDAMDTLRHAMHMAALAVEREQEARSLPCGTTVAALLLRGDRAHVAWCGDSRVYRLRLVSKEGGVSTWQPALLTRTHRDTAGELLRHLGSRRDGTGAVPEYSEALAKPGDVFALVTDGVWEVLGDEGVCRVLLDSHAGPVPVLNARWMAEELASRALERGGKGNATALVVRVPR